MSESIAIEFEPCTEAERAFFDTFTSRAEMEKRAADDRHYMQEQIRRGSLMGVLMAAGYLDQRERREIYKYMTKYHWNDPNPARCLCNSKGTCWRCKMDNLRAWADSEDQRLKAVEAHRREYEEELKQQEIEAKQKDNYNGLLKKYLVNGVWMTSRDFERITGRSSESINNTIRRHGLEYFLAHMDGKRHMSMVVFNGESMTREALAGKLNISRKIIDTNITRRGQEAAMEYLKKTYWNGSIGEAIQNAENVGLM